MVCVKRWLVPAFSLALFSVKALAAQVPPPDTLELVSGRSVEELVAGLPGEPVSLGEFIASALERNLTLEVTRVRRRLAEASVDVEGGIFDPTFGFQANVSDPGRGVGRSDAYGVGVSQILPWGLQLGVDLAANRSPSFTVGQPDDYGADLTLSFRQPLLEGFGTRDTDLNVARALRRSATHDLAWATEVAVAEVELAYWDLAEAEAIQAVLRRSMEIAEALLFRNEQLADRELVPEVEVITARSGVALRRSAHISARRARLDASERLVFLAWGERAEERLVQLDGAVKTVDPPSPSPAASTLADAGAQALASRSDLAAAMAQLQAAELAEHAARRARLPSLSLEGTVGADAAEENLRSSVQGLEGGAWSLGLSFSQPLFNRGDRGLSVSAELASELRRLDLVLVENQVRQDVRLTVRAVVAGEERAAAANEAADLARQQLESERQRLELGLGDSFRLLETEENAVQAELESVRARFDLARATTRFRLASGS